MANDINSIIQFYIQQLKDGVLNSAEVEDSLKGLGVAQEEIEKAIQNSSQAIKTINNSGNKISQVSAAANKLANQTSQLIDNIAKTQQEALKAVEDVNKKITSRTIKSQEDRVRQSQEADKRSTRDVSHKKTLKMSDLSENIPERSRHLREKIFGTQKQQPVQKRKEEPLFTVKDLEKIYDEELHAYFRQSEIEQANGKYKSKATGKVYDPKIEAQKEELLKSYALPTSSSFGKDKKDSSFYKQYKTFEEAAVKSGASAKQIAETEYFKKLFPNKSDRDRAFNTYKAAREGNVLHSFRDLYARYGSVFNVKEKGGPEKYTMPELEEISKSITNKQEQQYFASVLQDIKRNEKEYSALSGESLFNEQGLLKSRAALSQAAAIDKRMGFSFIGSEERRANRVDLTNAIKKWEQSGEFSKEQIEKLRGNLIEGKYFDYGVTRDQTATAKGKFYNIDTKNRRSINVNEITPQLALQMLDIMAEKNIGLEGIGGSYIMQTGKPIDRSNPEKIFASSLYGIKKPTEEQIAKMLAQMALGENITFTPEMSRIVTEGYTDEKTGESFSGVQYLGGKKGGAIVTPKQKFGAKYITKAEEYSSDIDAAVQEMLDSGYSISQIETFLSKAGITSDNGSQVLRDAALKHPELSEERMRSIRTDMLSYTKKDDKGKISMDWDKYYSDKNEKFWNDMLVSETTPYYIPRDQQAPLTTEDKVRMAEAARATISKNVPDITAIRDVFGSKEFISDMFGGEDSKDALMQVAYLKQNTSKFLSDFDTLSKYNDFLPDDERVNLSQYEGVASEVPETLANMEKMFQNIKELQGYLSIKEEFSHGVDFLGKNVGGASVTEMAKNILAAQVPEDERLSAADNRKKRMAEAYLRAQDNIDPELLKMVQQNANLQRGIMSADAGVISQLSMSSIMDPQSVAAYRLRRAPAGVIANMRMAGGYVRSADKKSYSDLTGQIEDSIIAAFTSPSVETAREALANFDAGGAYEQIQKQAGLYYNTVMSEEGKGYNADQLFIVKDILNSLSSGNNLKQSLINLREAIRQMSDATASQYLKNFATTLEAVDDMPVENLQTLVTQGLEQVDYARTGATSPTVYKMMSEQFARQNEIEINRDIIGRYRELAVSESKTDKAQAERAWENYKAEIEAAKYSGQGYQFTGYNEEGEASIAYDPTEVWDEALNLDDADYKKKWISNYMKGLSKTNDQSDIRVAREKMLGMTAKQIADALTLPQIESLEHLSANPAQYDKEGNLIKEKTPTPESQRLQESYGKRLQSDLLFIAKSGLFAPSKRLDIYSEMYRNLSSRAQGDESHMGAASYLKDFQTTTNKLYQTIVDKVVSENQEREGFERASVESTEEKQEQFIEAKEDNITQTESVSEVNKKLVGTIDKEIEAKEEGIEQEKQKREEDVKDVVGEQIKKDEQKAVKTQVDDVLDGKTKETKDDTKKTDWDIDLQQKFGYEVIDRRDKFSNMKPRIKTSDFARVLAPHIQKKIDSAIERGEKIIDLFDVWDNKYSTSTSIYDVDKREFGIKRFDKQKGEAEYKWTGTGLKKNLKDNTKFMSIEKQEQVLREIIGKDEDLSNKNPVLLDDGNAVVVEKKTAESEPVPQPLPGGDTALPPKPIEEVDVEEKLKNTIEEENKTKQDSIEQEKKLQEAKEEELNKTKEKNDDASSNKSGSGTGGSDTGNTQLLKQNLKLEREYQQYLNQRFSLLSKIEAAQIKYNISMGAERTAAQGVIQAGNIELEYLDKKNAALINNMEATQGVRKAEMDYQQKLKVNTMQQQKLLGAKGATSLWTVIQNDIRRATMRVMDFGIAARMLYKIPQAIQKITQSTKELDKAMTNVRIVGGYTEEEAKSFSRSYVELGKTLSISAVSIAESANEWLKVWVTINSFNCWNTLRAM